MGEIRDLPSKPIGVIASVAGGFDAVVQGWWILLFPVLLDLFLWFGPRISVMPVIENAVSAVNEITGENPAAQLVLEGAANLNYFSLLSITPSEYQA